MLLWALALVPSLAAAHAPPVGWRLLFDAHASQRPVVLANRGIVLPVAAGGWALLCNEAYGVTPLVEPAVLVRGTGRELLIANLEGVRRSTDEGCTFLSASPVTGARLTASHAAGPTPEALWVATGAQLDGNALYRSGDFGDGWQTVHENAEGEWFTGLRTAPSDPSRMYATLTVADYEAEELSYALAVSNDAGATWSPQPMAENRSLLGVHPSDPDIVFTQIQDTADGLWVLWRSADAGSTFTRAATSVGEFTSLAMAPGGGALWLGAALGGGLRQSVDDGASFTEVPDTDIAAVHCLEHHGGRFWMCANRRPNREGIWSQPEAGGEWELLLTFDQVSAPVACSDPEAASVCEQPWDDWAYELLGVPFPDGGVPDAGSDAGVEPLPDAGAGDAATPPEPAPTPGTPSHNAGSGGCRTAPGTAGLAWPLVLIGLGAVILRRRTGRCLHARSSQEKRP